MRVKGLGFVGLGFRAWGLGFRALGLVFREGPSFGEFRRDLGLMGLIGFGNDLGFIGFRVPGLGF